MKYAGWILIACISIVVSGVEQPMESSVPPCIVCSKPLKEKQHTTGYVTPKGVVPIHAFHTLNKYKVINISEETYRNLEVLYESVKQ